MRWLFTVVILVMTTIVVADDKAYCANSCQRKYSGGNELLSSCVKGCEFRGSLSDGSFAFIGCHHNCDAHFENATATEAAPCHFACSLPMTNMVFMSVNYNGKGEPEVKVVRHEGPPDSSSLHDVEQTLPVGSGDIFKALNLDRPPHFETGAEDLFDDDFERIEGRIARMFSDFRRRFIDRLADPSEQVFLGEKNYHTSHPHGHDVMPGTGSMVDNRNAEGKPILEVHAEDSESEESEESDEEEEEENEESGESREGHSASVFDWRKDRARHPFLIQTCFFAIALMAMLLSILLMIRVMRMRRYHRLQGSAVLANSRAHNAMAAPLPVKKVPLDGFAEPSGTPPPAYDQLSVHQTDEQKAPQ